MGTSAVVSIVDDKQKTMIKILTAQEGYKSPKMMESLYQLHKRDKEVTLKDVFNCAARYFGKDSLLVMDDKQIITEDDLFDTEHHEKACRPTFDDPTWCPFSKYGTADFVITMKFL